MPSLSPTAQALYAALAQRLATAKCQRGRFDISVPGAHLSLSGQRADGKIIFFWEFDRAFRQLVGAFLTEAHSSTTAQLTLLLDVAAGTVQQQFTTHQQVAAAQQAEARQAVAQRRTAPRDLTPYGPALAALVAARLAAGASLAYSHRDYCGMGLTRAADGRYQYGSVQDGDFEAPDQTFATQLAFERWLAAQSDYSLAGLESPDPGQWDNQRLTKARLLAFVEVQQQAGR